MKNFFLTALLTVAGSHALADNQCEVLFQPPTPYTTFAKQVTWLSPAAAEFSALEMRGVEFNAFQNAVVAAKEKGHSKLVFGTSRLDSNIYETRDPKLGPKRYVEMTSRLVSIDDRNLAAGAIFEGQATEREGRRLSSLEIMGVHYDALTEAIKKCMSAGYMFCVYQGTTLTRENDTGIINKYSGASYHTAAKAIVTGYSPSRNFIGSSGSWSRSSPVPFTQTQVQGIEFDAIKTAVFYAMSQGHQDVALGMVDREIGDTINGKWHTKMTATVTSIEGLNLKAGEIFSGGANRYEAERMDDLEVMGVQNRALENALEKCLAAGYAVCVYRDTSVGEMNNFRERRFNTSATAVVQGYR